MTGNTVACQSCGTSWFAPAGTTVTLCPFCPGVMRGQAYDAIRWLRAYPWPRLSLFPTIDMILAVIVSVWPSTERLIDRWWTGSNQRRTP